MNVEPGARRARDRSATEKRILAATGRVLSRDGFRGLGLNAVAREAGADKVLVYRYFGGLKGLLESYAESADFWPSEDELLPKGATRDPAEVAAGMLAGLPRALRKRRATQDVLVWELVEKNPLADRTAQARERAGLELMEKLPSAMAPGVDLPAVAAILTAGLTYLVLRSRTAPAWLGVSLRDEDGWIRLERAAAAVVRALVPPGSERPRSLGKARRRRRSP